MSSSVVSSDLGRGRVVAGDWPPRPAQGSSSRWRAQVRDRASLAILDEYTERWEQGERPALVDYLARLPRDDEDGRVELVYRDFCLAEVRGERPDPRSYIDRFPELGSFLSRLFLVHGACSSNELAELFDPEPNWPHAGDWIGPYHLRRELGQGAFSRVFLAEQVDLENRLVVLKVTTRKTAEAHLLARVRHAHIVEVEEQFLVEDGAFQVIRMPFWGGATLAEVLEQRRANGGSQGSGRALLAALDQVAAAEYPRVMAEQPGREILAGLSYEKAIAWIGARLAAGLEHAARKGVVHGDVKPSNIILTAGGIPMLLDFNLAQDSSESEAGSPSGERGGTLAYMAPERLRRLPGTRSADPAAMLDAGTVAGCEAAEFDAHRADLYSVGMVLLEALTGCQLGLGAAGESKASFDDAAWLRARSLPAATLIQEAERHGWSISPGFKAILKRCLDPAPHLRYEFARELAEDLDRFREDRPPAHANEDLLWVKLPRFVRRYRRVFQTAVVSLLVGVVLVVAAVRSISLKTSANQAEIKLGWHLGEFQGGAYRFQRSTLAEPLDAAAHGVDEFHRPGWSGERDLETAARALRDYALLAPGDWRERGDIQSLPDDDRQDLELWLLEQAYRYCHALYERVNSPEDWQRARTILDHVAGPYRLQAFEDLQAFAAVCLGGFDFPGGPGGPLFAGGGGPVRASGDQARFVRCGRANVRTMAVDRAESGGRG